MGRLDEIRTTQWNTVQRGRKTNPPNALVPKKPVFVQLSNSYRHLPIFAAGPPPPDHPPFPTTPHHPHLEPIPSKFKLAAKKRNKERRRQARLVQRQREDAATNALLDHHITWAEDERTDMAKADVANPRRRAIDTADDPSRPAKPIPILHRGRALGYALSTSARALVRQFLQPTRPALPFERLLTAAAAEAHKFPDFPDSLMSVGKTNDDGNVSIFTKDGVTVHREEDVLITLRGEPILISVRDGNGRYRIPLHQSRNSWTPRFRGWRRCAVPRVGRTTSAAPRVP
ncbi:hypothetical protein ACHAXT_003805 [Thalassiosira profunda]